jgi:enterochelin esterase-like enzyme
MNYLSPPRLGLLFVVSCSMWFAAAAASAQAPAARPGGQARGPRFVSPEVLSDRRITFRILAPKAETVRLTAGDIPGSINPGGVGRDLKKGDEGVWEITLGPIDSGAYRYTFNVDGVSVIDPRSPAISESNNNVWSVVYVPGADFMDRKDVPHGAVASVYYFSNVLGRTRRMHVYTPPGYESSQTKYPVFYLLHGAGDSDDSWTSVGRANFILDNLIAAGKAKPMIVVMPAGHSNNPANPPNPNAAPRPANAPTEFDEDFTKDLRLYIEKHYRVLADPAHRAIAGLSMGGGQTLSIALANPGDYGYFGVFSSGLFQRNLADWEKEHQGALDEADKSGLRLAWFRTGKDDFLMQNTRNTVELLKKHGFKPVFDESTGGHTWINWRQYLNEFAPQLFVTAEKGSEHASGSSAEPSRISGPVDTRFVPAGAFSAYIMYPARVLANPALAKLDLSDFAGIEKDIGFRPNDVEQFEWVFMFTQQSDGAQSPPRFGAAMQVRLTKPHGGEALVKHAIKHVEPEKADFAGKTYYRPSKDKNGYQANSPAIYLIDDRSFLIGDEPEIKAMLAAGEAKSPLAELMARLDPTADLSFYSETTDLIQQLRGGTASGGDLPSALKMLVNVADSIVGVHLSVKLTPEISLKGTVIAKDDAAAEKLLGTWPELKKVAEDSLARFRVEVGRAPPEVKPLGDYALAMLEKILSVTPERRGNEIVMQVDRLGTFDEFAKLLLPALTKAKRAAAATQSANNIRQLALAMFNYLDENRTFPPHAIYSKDGKPLLSWRVAVLKSFDPDLYKQFHLDEPWDSPNNKSLIAKMPSVFADSRGKPAGEGKTRYVVPVGAGTVFDGDKGTRITQITDGASNTLLIVEVGEDKAVTWTQPEDMPFDPAKPMSGLGTIPDDGFDVSFADGSVRRLKKAIDPETFRRLVLRADGEVIDLGKF